MRTPLPTEELVLGMGTELELAAEAGVLAVGHPKLLGTTVASGCHKDCQMC